MDQDKPNHNNYQYQIYFFDSYGTEPEEEIQKFMRKAAKYMEQTGVKPNDIKFDWNKLRHQRENSECGVYSINFLLRMLRGDDFNEITKKIMPDRMVNRCRNKYFKNQDVPIEHIKQKQ